MHQADSVLCLQTLQETPAEEWVREIQLGVTSGYREAKAGAKKQNISMWNEMKAGGWGGAGKKSTLEKEKWG